MSCVRRYPPQLCGSWDPFYPLRKIKQFGTPPPTLGKNFFNHACLPYYQGISFMVSVFLHLLYRLLPGISSQLLWVTVNISKFRFKDIYFIVCRSLILTAVILVPVATVDSEIEVSIEPGDTTCTSHTLIRMKWVINFWFYICTISATFRYFSYDTVYRDIHAPCFSPL